MGSDLRINLSETVREAERKQREKMDCREVATEPWASLQGTLKLRWSFEVILNHSKEAKPCSQAMTRHWMQAGPTEI